MHLSEWRPIILGIHDQKALDSDESTGAKFPKNIVNCTVV